MPSSPSIHTIKIEGNISPEQEKTYLHLPFQVPDGAVRLEVEYSYSAQISSNPTVTGGNTIDLGIFDQRGIEFLNAGFRGWSGSERHKFWITPTAAAPGYLPGPLNPGEWNVLFGLYKIAQIGCDYQIIITIFIEPDNQAAPLPRQPILSLPATLPDPAKSPLPVPGWLRGELHCHTWHSDGRLSTDKLVSLARQQGMDFLSIADHNTTASQLDLETMADPGLILIRAVESTTFKGHFNVIGIPDWVDFRVQSAEDMRAAIQFAKKQGALTSCNHPKPYGPDWDFPEVDNYDCIEVWNGPWTGLNEISLEYWVNQLSSGRQIPAVGGSDFHDYGERSGAMNRNIGIPTNWVYVTGEPSAENIITAIRHGHVSLTETPKGPFLLLTGEGETSSGDRVGQISDPPYPIQVRCLGGAGSLVRILDQRGVIWEKEVAENDQTLLFSIDTHTSKFARAELRSPDGPLRAITNPIYFSPPIR